MGSNPTDRTNEFMTQDFILSFFIFSIVENYLRDKTTVLRINSASGRKLLAESEIVQQTDCRI